MFQYVASLTRRGPLQRKITLELEWAPRAGQAGIGELTPSPGFRRMKAMVRHRTHSVEFKRQVALEYLAGDTLKGLCRRHDISRNLVRLWVKKFEAGEFDEDAVAIDLVQQYEARIAALERLVGKQALQIEFLKGAHKLADRRRGAPTSAIAGPPASASPKDAG